MQTRSAEEDHLKRISKIGIGVVIGIVIMTITFAAVVFVFFPSNTSQVESPATVVVSNGTVGSSMTLNARATWEEVSSTTNGATGTVTTVDVNVGAAIDAGDQIYSVNLRPVVAGQGSIPSFADTVLGDSGQAVEQLQSFLSYLGYWQWEIDGKFDKNFEDAIKLWQSDYGYQPDGVVKEGDIIWFDALPQRIALDEESLFAGARITAGEGTIATLSTEPKFTIDVKEFQAQSIATGTLVSLNPAPSTIWSAQIESLYTPEDSLDTVVAVLEGEGGDSICGDECGSIPMETPELIPAEIVLVTAQEGLVVPNAAITSTAAGETVLTSVDGNSFEIEVLTSAKGMSLIDGVPEGFVAVLPSATNE